MPEGERSANAGPPSSPGLSGSGSRYEVYGEIASGGMASVRYGRLIGPRGFTRAVAIKRLHPHFAKEPEFVTMFVDEARLSARLVHANIIHTLDVIETPGEVALVMEYVHGEALWTLLRLARSRAHAIPVPVACALIASVLHGLHAAHEACDDTGAPLHIVHRDVSPQNILVGSDGIPRVLDFGIAKALGRLRSTPSGEIKGKLGYIAREQLHGHPVDRRTDIYGASAVLWEVLTGVPLFDGPSEPAVVHSVLYDVVQPPSALRAEIPSALDAIVLRGLERECQARHASAHEMAIAIERAVRLATQSEIATWLQDLAADRLAERTKAWVAVQDDPVQQLQGTLTGTRRILANAATRVAAAETLVGASATLPAPRAHRLRGVVLTGIVCALLACAWFYARGRAPTPTPAVVHAVESPPPSAAELVVTAGVQPEESPAITGSIEPNVAAKSDRVRTRPPARTHAHNTAGAARDRASNKPCALYYEIDDHGIRRPKPECL